jgi:16S rRNA (guanine527-N7)-methyltransferase
MDPGRLEKLRQLAEFTLSYGRRVNLTADTEPALFWNRHIEDGLAAGRVLEKVIRAGMKPLRVLDVGSGNGVPGIIWAVLWGQSRISLLEARQKRAVFLKEAAEMLDLPHVEVLWGRAEDYGRKPEYREQFDLVAARALARMPVLLELTLPFVRQQGVVAAIKSRQMESEIRGSERAIEILGSSAGSCEVHDYESEHGVKSRIYLVPKCRPTPDQYPRPPGRPAARPLV